MASLSVYSLCSCEPCASGKPWYRCQDLDLVAEYECEPFDGIASVPDPSAVVEVELAHPGMRLVYVSLGDHYKLLLEKARKARSAATNVNS